MSATIEVHRRWTELPSEVTDFLATTTENVFLRPAWLDAWHACYLAPGWDPHAVVITDDQAGILAVVPLIERRVGPLRWLRFAGHGLGNYLDVVARPEATAATIRALLAHLRSIAPAVLEWRDLPDESPSRSALAGARAGVTRLYPCPRARFGSTWSTHFAAVVPNKKHRRSIERSVVRLSELGRLAFEANVQNDDGLIEELRGLHARRFGGTPNPLLGERFWSFLRRLVPSALGADLRVSTIRIDGRLISSVVGMRSGRTFVSYAPAFDPALASLTPGHAHLYLLQQALLKEGWEAFDFSKGADFYKRRWSNEETWNWEYTFGFGLLGRLVATVLFLRTRSRAWARAHGITMLVRRILSRGRPHHRVDPGAGMRT